MLNLFIIIYHGNKGEVRINFNDVKKMIFPSVLICNQFHREKGYIYLDIRLPNGVGEGRGRAY